MEGRTNYECRILNEEAQQDELAAMEHAEDNPTFAGYLERRAAWKRYLGNGHNILEEE